MKDRPSYPELYRKLKQGREAVSAKQISLLKPDHIHADLLELNYRVEDLVKMGILWIVSLHKSRSVKGGEQRGLPESAQPNGTKRSG